MIDPDNSYNIFTAALNERRAQLNIIFDPDSDFPSLYHGGVQIKIYPETVYFRWTIMESLTIGQGSLPLNEIPSSDDVMGYVQSKIIESVQNYCIRGKYVYRVDKWSWDLTNLDVEPVKKILKLLERVKRRPQMFMEKPNEVESFLTGIQWAYRILGFQQDRAIVKQSCAELEIKTLGQRLQRSEDYTWDLIDKILQSEIVGWKRTYGIS
ncbi:MAG: hypothetical protein H6662_06090 [Ardenticatenaceae bacterium]|nr:hypothetical protein [Anaerolineales bacterium]MCB8921136.1 hypothetical protein [Ardenticatenaceae bacterium]MCB8990841.1 hypothetical protein [Ardenticatenaceae bacterium]MCB9004465.1 hypothetical protein [Ardenticatenaceae bacterium]